MGRTTRGLCQLFDELRERKVDLVSLKDGFSLDFPAGRLHARILASVAEYETEVRAERVAAGQAVARRKGKKWGGSKKGWRWRVSDDQVAAIHDMRGRGKRITHIARVTGLSRPVVAEIESPILPEDTRRLEAPPFRYTAMPLRNSRSPMGLFHPRR